MWGPTNSIGKYFEIIAVRIFKSDHPNCISIWAKQFQKMAPKWWHVNHRTNASQASSKATWLYILLTKVNLVRSTMNTTTYPGGTTNRTAAVPDRHSPSRKSRWTGHCGPSVWSLAGSPLWMKEILQQFVDGKSHCNPMIYSVLHTSQYQLA